MIFFKVKPNFRSWLYFFLQVGGQNSTLLDCWPKAKAGSPTKQWFAPPSEDRSKNKLLKHCGFNSRNSLTE
jgi:hypothetical protein